MIDIIAEDKSIILYRKTLNKITGGVLASILLSQLIYWWKTSGGEFFKFKCPCRHEKYKSGDSWCEELGYSIRQFDTAIKKLEDNGFVTRRTTIDRVTFYTLNECVLSKSLNAIYQNCEVQDIESAKRDIVIYTETTTETTTENDNTQRKITSESPQKEIIFAWNKSTGRTTQENGVLDRLIIKRLSEYGLSGILKSIKLRKEVQENSDSYHGFVKEMSLFDFLQNPIDKYANAESITPFLKNNGSGNNAKPKSGRITFS